LRAIFERYTGKSISEYYFVSKYLDDVDAIGFFDEIIDTIIASPEYHTGMCKVLATKYQNMFDQQLDENDIAYVFDSVKALKLDLVNESIIDILTNVKQETDEFISHIFKQFKRVLDRPPDMYELEEYVTYYRRSNVTQTLDGIDTTLERILMHMLEFHDIIKKQIKIVKKDILPSIMYDVLNKLIKQIDDFDMGTMDKAIATLV
jgi:hypothetical protein